jgi:dihydrofolate reductase
MKVFLIAAVSLDGFIAPANSRTVDWTGSADKKFYSRRTREAGLMIMGRTTYESIGKPLPGRRTIVYTRHPDQFHDDRVEATNLEPAMLLKQLKREGYKEVAICGGGQIYQLFQNAGVITDLYLTYAPVVFGAGTPLFAGEVTGGFTLIATEKLDDNTVMSHYATR